VSRKLFAHDLPHDFPGYRFFAERHVELQRLIDQSLVALSGSLGLCLEALENRIIEVDRDARLPVVGITAPRLPFEKS
jgi:hypothetical protein